MKETIENQANLDLKQALVDDVIVENGKVKGVRTSTGTEYLCEALVLTTGTYLKGRIIIGEFSYEGGPNNQIAANNLSSSLRKLGLQLDRFKTGTPPRLHHDTVDFSKMEIQPGADEPIHFSHDKVTNNLQQVSCWLTYTNPNTHKVIEDNLHRAPMYTGMIEGTGTRYCPAIEVKVVRFGDKDRHQIFLEPEGLNTKEMYLQGFNTSMPEDVQVAMVRSVAGLEQAEIMRSGYAIEYDVVLPHQLYATLETKLIENLFTAGQLNGTSGYEEAAAQGLVAGINAALKIQGREPFILDRADAYIGVMIDDLVTKELREPYRLLTSRAEYRLLLRNDNADLRLREYGYELGLITEEQYNRLLTKKTAIVAEIRRLEKELLRPTVEVLAQLERMGTAPIDNAISLATLLKRPEIEYEQIELFSLAEENISREIKEQVTIQIKYAGYIDKQLQLVDKMKRLESKLIPKWVDYNVINGISFEAKEKLTEYQPTNIGQASRIAGITPADISILLIHIEHKNMGRSDVIASERIE
jgi:tRNA uridine 5-carboxymethylaminomethyl modification enzyme